MSSRLQILKYAPDVESASPFPTFGYVTSVSGLIVEGYCPGAVVGATCEIYSEEGSCLSEVVGLRDDKVLLMPLGELRGLGTSSRIRVVKKTATAMIGDELVGRVIDGLGNPLDGGPEIECDQEFALYSSPINPLQRTRISDVFDLGVRSVNGLLTLGKGQRVGILSGSGVGKSMLLGMMARASHADINVIALIGERGREVREFLERDVGVEGMKKSIVVCATSDTPPLIRMRAAFLASVIAEYFRKKSKNVLFMMDSVTRFAMAQREVGLSAGEPPTTKGYPPSVFTQLPRLFERAGNTDTGGSITGIYTVLIEADDINDPIGDAVRSIVDGHIMLSRKLAAKSHYPAIDVPMSASRVMADIAKPEQRELASRIKTILANYAEAEDLINIGAYVKGSNPGIDEAIQYIEPIRKFLKQNYQEKVSMEQTLTEMKQIFGSAQGAQGTGRR